MCRKENVGKYNNCVGEKKTFYRPQIEDVLAQFTHFTVK